MSLRMELKHDHINMEVVLKAGRPGHSLTTRWDADALPYREHPGRLDATSAFFKETEKVLTPVLEYLGPGNHELSPAIITKTYQYLISEQN